VVVENVSMTAEVYFNMMTKADGILAAIREKMPWARGAQITVQHDGAPGHVEKVNRVALPEAGLFGGYHVVFETQPAQSPDMNICDLCFFNSLQHRSFELRSNASSEMELMQAVQQAWTEYQWETLERAWGLQFAVYRSILDARGGNQYEKPHTNVRARQLAGAGTIDPYVTMPSYLTGMEARDALDNEE
jgi:hypothetical protein